MTKNELIEAIASKTELTKTDVDKVITSFADVITDALVLVEILILVKQLKSKQVSPLLLRQVQH